MDLSKDKTHRTEVWAHLRLSISDSERITTFFAKEIGITESFIATRLHLTVYHARRQMEGVRPMIERTSVALYGDETRFMVLAPGGENPRPEIYLPFHKIGIRVRKQSVARASILSYRERLTAFETSEVLGIRRPSTATKSAFGSRSFQPHMTLLKAGHGIGQDLARIGEAFRAKFGCFKFDRFAINIRELHYPGDS